MPLNNVVLIRTLQPRVFEEQSIEQHVWHASHIKTQRKPIPPGHRYWPTPLLGGVAAPHAPIGTGNWWLAFDVMDRLGLASLGKGAGNAAGSRLLEGFTEP